MPKKKKEIVGEEEEKINYKINITQHYKVFCNCCKGRTFYKLAVYKKNYDGTKSTYYLPVRFSRKEPPKEGDIIRIKRGFEDVYTNPKDKFNTISVIIILDYETIEHEVSEEERTINAISDFREGLTEDYSDFDAELPF